MRSILFQLVPYCFFFLKILLQIKKFLNSQQLKHFSKNATNGTIVSVRDYSSSRSENPIC